MGKDHYEVCYGDGTSFGDCAEIEFAWHLGASSLGVLDDHLGECLENIDTLVYAGGGGVVEGGFMRAGGENGTVDPTNTCFDCTNCVQGILYIEHRN